MIRATPISDEELFELLRGADPLAAGASAPSALEGERVLQRILASERVSTGRVSWYGARRRLVLSVASCGGAAAAAVAAVLVLTAGSAPSVAFAGWSAEPTAPSGGQVQAAEADCQRTAKLPSLKPALADTRGPYTLLVYGENVGTICVTGPSLQSPAGSAHVLPAGAFIAASVEAGRQAAAKRGVPRSSEVQTRAALAPDTVRTVLKGGQTTTSGAEYGLDVGRVGRDVTAVKLVLEDGSRVQATTANGWFAAWWPGGKEPETAEITTTSGTVTEELKPSQGYETPTSSAGSGTP